MQARNGIDEDEAEERQQNVRSHFQGIEGLVEFFFERRDLFHQQPDLEGPEGQEVSASFMRASVNPYERADDQQCI